MEYKRSKMKCYFAHAYESRNTPAEAEIITELKSRGVEVINPFDGEDDMMLKKYGRTCGYYPDPPYKLGREIWMQDLRRVGECDMLLVYVEPGKRLSGGCGWELGEAYRLHKFIQIISVSKHPAFAYVLTGANQMYETVEDWKKFNQLRWK